MKRLMIIIAINLTISFAWCQEFGDYEGIALKNSDFTLAEIRELQILNVKRTTNKYGHDIVLLKVGFDVTLDGGETVDVVENYLNQTAENNTMDSHSEKYFRLLLKTSSSSDIQAGTSFHQKKYQHDFIIDCSPHKEMASTKLVFLLGKRIFNFQKDQPSWADMRLYTYVDIQVDCQTGQKEKYSLGKPFAYSGSKVFFED